MSAFIDGSRRTHGRHQGPHHHVRRAPADQVLAAWAPVVLDGGLGGHGLGHPAAVGFVDRRGMRRRQRPGRAKVFAGSFGHEKEPTEFRYGRPRASDRCPLPGRLRGTVDRPPAPGHQADSGQGRRIGLDPCRRPRLQAVELDESAVCADGQHRRGRLRLHRSVGDSQSRWRHPVDLDRRGAARLQPRVGRRPRPGEGRRRSTSAGFAGRAPRNVRCRLDARATRVLHRDRSGRPARFATRAAGTSRWR